MKSSFFDLEEIPNVLEKAEALGFRPAYDYEKHRITLALPKEEREAYLRLPITVSCDESLHFDFDSKITYLMLLVQSGSASIGVFEGEKCLEHKVFSAYMVRKKQGKSQVKYLKTKGKSRAGSRVRLAKTLEFFEDINQRLQNHFDEYTFDRITLSCSKILIPYLYGAKVATPFDKRDPRIYKIPKHLHQPNFEVMLGMQRYLNKAELVFDEDVFGELEW